ncbi:MAG: hypothetical protein AABY18_08030 [Candidatus Thermoplasmatota archaeon]
MDDAAANPPIGGSGGGAFVLPGRDALRDRIVEHLRRVGHDSISGITRALQREGEAPAHRLTVAGYLQAMADAGLLKEVERPPSKEYLLANPETHWSLHQRLWRLLQDVPRSDDDRVRLLLACLQLVLNRPIFAGELLHAGAARVPDALDRHIVPDDVRRAYRKLFERKATPRIDLPQRDPLLMLPPGDATLGSATVQEVLRRLAAKATGADHLVAERPAAPTQKSLDVGGGS